MRYMTKTRPVSVMDQIFDSMFCDEPVVRSASRVFPVDIIEEDNRYVVSAELPGFTDDEVEITLNDNLLVISGAKTVKAEKVEKEGEESVQKKAVKFLLRERGEGQFKRSFNLPKDGDREDIKATLTSGILNLSIGKKPESKPFSIKIN